MKQLLQKEGLDKYFQGDVDAKVGIKLHFTENHKNKHHGK